ncbi:hypothetical protein TNCV_1319481 [Trichonephila clavipes]|nr:hypothetical protein TNCV_1319481 [Trichonephila clavipes]
MDIELISDKPIKTKPYRMSPRQINILREEIKRLLELGVIEIGQSDYTSPLILVESPNKDPRPCVDYRRLDEITRAEFFPLPNMEEIVEKVSVAPYVTVMDLSKGYFQIPLTPRAQRYAAFVTPFGTYIPKKMMFGLVCAPYYFCKLMAQVLEGLEPFALPYIDDIAIFSQGWKDHVKHIDIVLGRLRKAGLKVKPSKCKFAQEEVLFLGHRIGSGSRSPSDLKIKAIADFPRPTTKTQVRSFLGLVGYYSHYIPNYSTIASPLTDALKGKIKKEKITWDEKCGKAFEELKAKLVSQPILFAPDFAPDFATDFILQTDARQYYCRTILDRVLGARAAGVHYRLFSVWTLVPVRRDQQLSDHSTVDEIASGAADCRLTYTMVNCPQRRLEKPGEKEKREREKEGKRARKRQGLVVFRKRRGESQSFLLGDADEESETRMSKNALRTGRRQAVESLRLRGLSPEFGLLKENSRKRTKMPTEQEAKPAEVTPSLQQWRSPSTFRGAPGEDPLKWLKEYDRVANFNKWDDMMCLANVYFFLDGTARQWYVNNEDALDSWEAFKNGLSGLFGDRQKYTRRAEEQLKCRAQRSGESTQSYIQSILGLCQEALLTREINDTASFIKWCNYIEDMKQKRVGRPRFERLPNVVPVASLTDETDLVSLIRTIVREEVH